MTEFLPYVLLGMAAGVVAGFIVARRRAKPKYFAATEYWVYLPGEELPAQEAVMERMFSGGSPLGKTEGILMSDIRLHVSLILRSKNPHVFRPDLFTETEIDASSLAALTGARSMVKIRYVSEIELPDMRHLRFIPYLADAYATLGRSALIFDAVTEQLLSTESFRAFLKAGDLAESEEHIRVFMRPSGEFTCAATKGLIKKGLPELNTLPVAFDNRLLAAEVMRAIAGEVWKNGLVPEVRVQCFDDEFIARLQPGKGSPRNIRIQRVSQG